VANRHRLGCRTPARQAIFAAARHRGRAHPQTEYGMKIGILGTGMVGSTIGGKLLSGGHAVMMGSRTAGNEKAVAWARAAGGAASHGTFADAARFGELVFNCTAGGVSLAALEAAGAAHLAGKILVDVANPLDTSRGMPPRLGVCNTDSLGEQIQRAFPSAKVVKTLNTMNCVVMVNPGLVPGDHTVFLSGNDAGAKETVAALLREWGWPARNILDVGDITTARGTEMLLPLWLRLWGRYRTPNFNFHIVTATGT
jgi:predicted dinucleotide-binding enzyme